MQPELSFSTATDIIEGCRRTGILPIQSETVNFSDDERAQLVAAWREGMGRVAEESDRAYREAFAARGWAFRWFTQWNPRTAADQKLSAALDEAIDVAERHLPRITEREFNLPDNMGIVQSKGFGGAEVVQVKREPYGTMLLISIYCVTGPMNFEPGAGVEFEPGARSHVFHLCYQRFPTTETVVGDLAAYPLITNPSNRNRDVRCSLWHGEGWTGPHVTRPWLHRPWNTISELRQAA